MRQVRRQVRCAIESAGRYACASTFRFRPARERIALAAGEPARCGAAAGRRRRRADPCSNDRRVRDLPDLLRPATCSSSTTPTSFPPRLLGVRRIAARRRARDRCDAASSASPRIAWRAFARPGKRLAVGRPHPLRQAAARACLLGALDATVEGKGRGRRDHAALRSRRRPVLDEAIAALGDMPLPPYIAGKRAADDARPAGLPDDLCAARRARLRRRPPACISRRPAWQRSPRAASPRIR